MVRQMVDEGIEPSQVADRVIDAVRTDTFYVLTHDVSRSMVEARMHDILEGRSPGDMSTG